MLDLLEKMSTIFVGVFILICIVDCLERWTSKRRAIKRRLDRP